MRKLSSIPYAEITCNTNGHTYILPELISLTGGARVVRIQLGTGVNLFHISAYDILDGIAYIAFYAAGAIFGQNLLTFYGPVTVFL